jgi:hypothetical protein
MNAVRQLFAKKPATAVKAPAPAKRVRNRLTRTALNAAIDAACADLAKDSATYQTLESLRLVANDGEVVKTFDDPVSIAELDAVLTDMQDLVSSSTLNTLKRARALLAAKDNPAWHGSEPAQYVTVAQLKAHDDALFDAFAWALGAISAELNRGQPSQAHALNSLQRSASSPERKKLFADICKFREADVPKMTQEEWLRYQARGPG